MTGTTGLKDLRVECIVGIHPHERSTVQTVYLDIEIDYDFAVPAASDAIADAIDYDAVVTSVTGLLQASKFQLIETMAEHAAALVLRQSPASTVRIEVRKPAAVPSAACSFARVERRR